MVKKRMLFVMCSALLLGACSKDEEKPVPPVSAEPEQVEEEVVELPYTMPLQAKRWQRKPFFDRF